MSTQRRPGRPVSVRDVLCPVRLAFFRRSRAEPAGFAGKIDKLVPLSTAAGFTAYCPQVASPRVHGQVNGDSLDVMRRPRARLAQCIWLLVIGPCIGAAPAAHARATAEWMWPLDPKPVVLRPFEPPAEPWLAGHRGVDLSARFGQQVRSAGAGVVTFAGLVAGLPVVTVSHGQLRTTYEPVEPAVQVGDHVRAGDLVGRLGQARTHCGAGRPCLHWGLLRGRTYLDPLALLRSGPIRLLPRVAAPNPAAPDAASRPRPLAFREERDHGLGRGQAAILSGSALTLGALAFAARRRWLEAAEIPDGSGR
jgi:hypothetical protein